MQDWQMDDNVSLSAGPISGPHLSKLTEAIQGLSQSELVWVSGYLYGLAQSGQPVAGIATAGGASVSAVAEPIALTILFASQTGNAKAVAEQLQQSAAQQGIQARLVAINDYAPKQLKKERYLAIVTSTYGEGEPPEAAIDFYAQLKKGKVGQLPDLHYAVLGLGDSSYEFFCQTGKDFDDLLEQAGATRLQAPALLDVDYQAAATEWSSALVGLLAQAATPVAAPVTAGSAATPVVVYDKQHPFTATLQTNQKITGRDSDRDIRHLEFSLEESGLTYQPGDALGIWFENDPALVDEVLVLTKLTGNEKISVGDKTLPLRHALATDFELTRLHPGFLSGLADISTNAILKKIAEDKTIVRKITAETQLVDVLKQYPVALTAEQLVSLLRPLTPRLYSIASAQSEVEEEVHLTVGVQRFPQPDGSVRSGGASSYLADRVAEGQPVRIFVEHNDNFRLPANPETPIIMVGPGTGIAPFRAFLQERGAQGATGKNWLFFGNPHFTQDFLYQVEWQKYVKSGLLTQIDLAFSRDQDHKIYVQDKLTAKGAEVWQWLLDGAYFYVCGDANRMAKDVEQALLAIIAEHGHKSAEEAETFLSELRQSKRYQRDVY